MQPDKRLIARNISKNYEGENEFKDITIYLPFKYDGDNMLDYIIQLNVINKNNVGDVITLTEPTIYKDRYRYEFPIPSKWTAVPGKISLWLKFLKNEKVVGFTNEVCAIIFDTREITDFIPEQSLSLLDEWSLKMNSVNQTVVLVLEDIEKQKEQIGDIVVRTPIIGENGHWFLWDSNESKYTDSGLEAKGSDGRDGINGQDGVDGKDGYTPVKGTDYFTETDIKSLNIPSKTSDLDNDSDFATIKDVEELINKTQSDDITHTIKDDYWIMFGKES